MRASNIIIIATALAATAAMTSCEKTLPYNDSDSKTNNVVMNAVATAGTPFAVSITQSYPYTQVLNFDSGESDSLRYGKSAITSANATLTVNGSQTYALQYDSQSLMYKSDYVPQDGDRLSISVSTTLWGSSSASATVPAVQPIEMVDYSVYKTAAADSLKADITLRLNDPQGDNYYRLVTRTVRQTADGTLLASDVFTSSDELFYDGSLNTGYGDWEPYVSNVFDDHLFDGTQREVTLHVARAIGDGQVRSLYVELQSVSPELYFYLKSMQAYRITNNYDYSENLYIYSNVDNGYGIVGGMAASRVSIPIE